MSSERQAWIERWREGRIGFHRADVHPDLLAHEAMFDDGPHRVLVPLCGKSVDVAWLASRGHRVVAVDLATQALDALAGEAGVRLERTQQGAFEVYRAGRLTLLAGDALALDPDVWGHFDRIWDRAALVALPRAMRLDYARVMRRLLAPEATILLNSFAYDQSRMDGPPWSVPEAEVRDLYDDCTVEVLAERDAVDGSGFADRGHAYWRVTTYSIRPAA